MSLFEPPVAITVVSTGLRAPTKDRCLESVRRQQGVAFRHVYVEASEQDPPRNVITNLASVITGLPASMPVALVDGDDWLLHDFVLARIVEKHAEGMWVTYGSFFLADGREGFAAPVDWSRPVREQHWTATHLKTIRAGLFHRLRAEDLAWPEGAPVPWDQVVMLAALEMAGPDRSCFIPEPLYTYNFWSSHEANATPEGQAEERRLAAVVRLRAPYARLEAL